MEGSKDWKLDVGDGYPAGLGPRRYARKIGRRAERRGGDDLRNGRDVEVKVALYWRQVDSLLLLLLLWRRAGQVWRRGNDGTLEVRRVEVAIVLASNLDAFVQELAFQVIAGAWPPELLAAEACGQSLVTLAKCERASQAPKHTSTKRLGGGPKRWHGMGWNGMGWDSWIGLP